MHENALGLAVVEDSEEALSAAGDALLHQDPVSPAGAGQQLPDATPPLGIVPDVEDALHFHFADRFHHAGTVDRATGQLVRLADDRGLGAGTSSRSASAKVADLSKQHSRLAAEGSAASSGRCAATVATACAVTGMIMSKSFRRTTSSSGTRRIKPSR